MSSASKPTLHKNASVLLVTDTGARLKVTGLTDEDIERIAALISDIVCRDEETGRS